MENTEILVQHQEPKHCEYLTERFKSGYINYINPTTIIEKTLENGVYNLFVPKSFLKYFIREYYYFIIDSYLILPKPDTDNIICDINIKYEDINLLEKSIEHIKMLEQKRIIKQIVQMNKFNRYNKKISKFYYELYLQCIFRLYEEYVNFLLHNAKTFYGRFDIDYLDGNVLILIMYYSYYVYVNYKCKYDIGNIGVFTTEKTINEECKSFYQYTKSLQNELNKEDKTNYEPIRITDVIKNLLI